MKKIIYHSLIGAVVLGLSACGGGSASSSDSSSQPSANHPHFQQNDSSPTLSSELTKQIKEKKVTATYMEEVSDIATSNTQFIILDQIFGKEEISFDLFPRYQLTEADWVETYNTNKNEHRDTGIWRVYNQLYSGVLGYGRFSSTTNGVTTHYEPDQHYGIFHISGVNTETEQLPASGNALYKGIAFDKTQQGDLEYLVDFSNKVGTGKITGLSQYGTITLEKAAINNAQSLWVFDDHAPGISGLASSTISPEKEVLKGYELQFFGPNAEEIAGTIKTKREQYFFFPNDDQTESRIGFGGTKQ